MINELIPNSNISALNTILTSAKKITIIPHVNPDGDAIGSALGWMHAIKEIYDIEANVLAPNAFPDFLKWLPGAEKITIFEENKILGSDMIASSDAIFVLDFNDIKRAEGMEDSLANHDNIIMIDHHPYPKLETSPCFSFPECSATCEVVYRILLQLGHKDLISKNSATCLYTGIMTDTGSLSYNSSNAELYSIVANLLHCGIDKQYIHDQLFASQSENRLRLMGYCLSKKMELMPEVQASLITLSIKEQETFNHQKGDSEGFVNIPLSIEGINISVFMMETEDKIKISFRSKGNIAVNSLAANYFNGGGHNNAAGGAFFQSLDEAVALFKDKVKELI